MKKYSLWINAFLLTFLLSIGAVVVWFTMNDINLEAVKPPSLLLSPVSFPGLAKKISESTKGKSGYFPKGIFSGAYKEQEDSLNDWYGKFLKGLGERSLLDISNQKTEVYRFLWLRTFHHPIFVRIERKHNEINLYTKESNGAGGYELGKISRSFNRKLNETEWYNFLNLLEKANYWKLQTKEEILEEDGAQWILEGVKDERYHVVDKQSPGNDDYGEACIYLLKLSGIDTDKLGDDLY
jgi:hypothetical protein